MCDVLNNKSCQPSGTYSLLWGIYAMLNVIMYYSFAKKKKFQAGRKKKKLMFITSSHNQPSLQILLFSTWYIFSFSVNYQNLTLVFKKVLPFREAKTRKTQRTQRKQSFNWIHCSVLQVSSLLLVEYDF